jgi:hydrogenase-4 component B
VNALGLAFAFWILTALAGLLLQRWRGAVALGAVGAVVGCGAAAMAAIGSLAAPGPQLWTMPWTWPGGALALRLDAVAAVFLLPVAVIGALCAIYGVAYLRQHTHDHPASGAIAASLAAYNVLLFSMALVVTADNLVLLILAWELMTLSSWALVTGDHEIPAVRAAGLQYLIAGHMATAALLLFALLMAGASGTFTISALSALGAFTARAAVPANVLFILALIGFGTKAGIVPMHVWLPDAHSAAPSHVSALMSAVMITMGFYGLARFVPLLGDPAAWWGYLLMALGAAGAVGGIAFGLAQRDVKRILAYSTVENAGVITLAVGVGVLGTALGEPMLVGLAWTAALLHVWNHALAKTLLFLGFGAAVQAVGSRRLDAMGGLLRRWPLVGAILLLGAAAIASLPGLNVFTSEWLLMRDLFAGMISLHGAPQIALAGGIVSLALMGGIAVACFSGLVGLSLLGSPRTAAAAGVRPPVWAMRLPLIGCAIGCLAVATAPTHVSAALANAVHAIAPVADVRTVRATLEPLALLTPLLGAGILVVLTLRLLARRTTLRREDTTWGCGYPVLTPRMQYTSTSFGEPLTRVLQPVLHTETRAALDLVESGQRVLWPLAAAWRSDTADRLLVQLYLPIVDRVRRVGLRLRAYRSPHITQSLLYVIVTVLVLLGLLFRPGLGR